MAPRRQFDAQVEDAPVEDAGTAMSYPSAKYHKCATSQRHPNGYIVRRVNNADENASLGQEWKDSPDDL